MKKCILISDSFKGTLSSLEICAIGRRCFERFLPDWELRAIPVADGGEGTLDCFGILPGAELIKAEVAGPYFEKLSASYVLLGDTAVIEMAQAAGLPLVGNNKNPAKTTTHGVGELMRLALEAGCRKIMLGIGGSATNDGGCGALAALGAEFYDAAGESFIPVGGTLGRIARINAEPARDLLRGIDIRVMCDVTNPLFGEKGAAYIFGPQKGADKAMVEALDAGLRVFSEKLRELGEDVAAVPGAGAAGGMGAGLMAVIGAELQSGIDAVLDASDFERELSGAALVISGEGRLDSQSADGKVISGIARRCKAAGVPMVVLSGAVADSAANIYDCGVSAVFNTNRDAKSMDVLKESAAADYEAALGDLLRLIRIFG